MGRAQTSDGEILATRWGIPRFCISLQERLGIPRFQKVPPNTPQSIGHYSVVIFARRNNPELLSASLLCDRRFLGLSTSGPAKLCFVAAKHAQPCKADLAKVA